MISTTRTIGIVPSASISIATVFIVKIYVETSIVHSFDFLTSALIAIKNKRPCWREKNLSMGVTIASAAVLGLCVTSIRAIREYTLFGISISPIFIVPVSKAGVEMTGAAATVSSNAVLSPRPNKYIVVHEINMRLRTVIRFEIASSAKFKVRSDVRRAPSICIAPVFVVLISPPTGPS